MHSPLNHSPAALSSASLVSTSTNTTSSSAPLCAPHSQQKDYSAAFGQLSTLYGLSGAAPAFQPCPSSSTPSPSLSTDQPKKRSKSAGHDAPSSTSPARTGKNYAAAFGALSAALGIGASYVNNTRRV